MVMKKLTLSLVTLLISTTCLLAQENSSLKNTQEETVTKTVVSKGVTKETSVTKTVVKEKQVIDIKDTGKENQNEVYSTKKETTVKSGPPTVTKNKENDAAIKEVKKEQKQEIKDSKTAQLKKYEKEKKEMKDSAPKKDNKKKY